MHARTGEAKEGAKRHAGPLRVVLIAIDARLPRNTKSTSAIARSVVGWLTLLPFSDSILSKNGLHCSALTLGQCRASTHSSCLLTRFQFAGHQPQESKFALWIEVGNQSTSMRVDVARVQSSLTSVGAVTDIKVTVVRARNLAAGDANGLSDPYVVVTAGEMDLSLPLLLFAHTA
jgi:hypothetical protein